MSESTQESIQDLCKMLSANDWTQRLEGIQLFQEKCETETSLVTGNIVKVGSFHELCVTVKVDMFALHSAFPFKACKYGQSECRSKA